MTALQPLVEAVSGFASRAAQKLRGQASHAGEVLVFVRTSPFRQCARYSRSLVVPLRRPTSDTGVIVAAATAALREIFRPGIKFAKAGVMLMSIQPAGVEQAELDFHSGDADRDRGRLMQALDAVNDRWGRGTMRVASGQVGNAPCDWTTRQERKTTSYTTDWNEIPTARS